MNYIGATMTLNSSSYSIIELLLLLLLRQLPIASVERLLWSEIAETSLVAVVLPWSPCRYYTVITLLIFWVNSSNHYNDKDNWGTGHVDDSPACTQLNELTCKWIQGHLILLDRRGSRYCHLSVKHCTIRRNIRRPLTHATKVQYLARIVTCLPRRLSTLWHCSSVLVR